MNKKKSWPIDEFASFELQEDTNNQEFTIILKGKIKHSDLIAFKIGEIEFTKEEIEEHVE